MFMSHQWAFPQIAVMLISIFGMFIYLLILASINDLTDMYYGVADWVLDQSIFWFFGFVSIPFVAAFTDFIGNSLYMFFYPPQEMLFHEAEITVS